MLRFAAILGSLLCAGCAHILAPAAEHAADAIVEYCEKEPLDARQVYRNSIAAYFPTTGYDVRVTCPGDPVD